MKKINRAAIAVLAAAAIVCTAVLGRISLMPETEQTKPDPPAPDPLVLNTVERQDDIVLTVIRDQETVFQYEGDVQLWKGDDGKAYGIIYLDGEEVLQ